jgi:hypothetical protein
MYNKRGEMVKFPDARCPVCGSAAVLRGDGTMVVGAARNATFNHKCYHAMLSRDDLGFVSRYREDLVVRSGRP